MTETQSSQAITITAEQADAIAALARLYMSTETMTLAPGSDLAGWIAVETHKWRWMIDEKGRVAGEGPKEDASDAF